VEKALKALLLQSLSVLFLCALADFGSGSVLEGMKERFHALPGLLTVVPPLVDLRGNIGCALGSRLGTALHLGTLKPRFSRSWELVGNALASLFLSVVGSVTVVLVSLLIRGSLGLSFHLLSLLWIAAVSGMLAGVLITFLTILVAFQAFRRGWDPDTVTGPVMTTAGDIITVLCIYLAVLWWG
jgi:mgtE-like transporter